MAAQVSYPGVYTSEFEPGAPIQGVGTSTAAFLGPSRMGPLNEPVKVTSWDQFLREFGELPLDGFYLWYAVRGFFFNQGNVCYVIRVSNASHDQLILDDQNNQSTIQLSARTPGTTAPQITAEVDDNVHVVDPASARLFRPTANIVNATGAVVTVDSESDALQFRPGDKVTLEDPGATVDATILRIEGAIIRLTELLPSAFNGGSVRLANLESGGTSFRAVESAGLGAGSVIEISQTPGPVSEIVVVRRIVTERITPVLTTYRVDLSQGLSQGYDLAQGASDITLESFEFRITVDHDGITTTYDQLGMHPEHANYFRRVLNEDANGLLLAEPVEPPNISQPPANRPQTLAAQSLTGGTDDDPASLSASDYRDAIAQLERIDDINMVAVPDRTDLDVQMAVIAHCELMHDRFAILDSRRGAPPFGTDSVEVHRGGLDTARGFAALYYPWLFVSPAAGDDPALVPPSGHIAGIYARTDNNRGVHKAPAGNEALINGALGVERTLSNIEQGQLNVPSNINIIRVFKPGGRPVVWGARTTTSNTNWQYVNVRRLFLFLEESIEEGIRWAVFEPNNLQLWQKLKRTITEFLTRVWRDGALFGATAEEAFYVRIDKILNPFPEQALGRLNIEIGVRPSFPAEFIVVRIGIWQGDSEFSET